MKQEQNAILKGTFREQNKNEGGRKKGEEEDRVGEIKTLQQKFLKIKTIEGWQDKVEEGSQMVEQKDKGRENRREEINLKWED